MAVDKPDTTRVWASAALPADIEDPDISSPGKVEDGYRDEIPVYQHHNWIFNEASKSAKYLNEQGIGIWDAVTTFPIGAIVKGSDLNLYQAIVEQSNNDPVGDKTNWRPFVTSTTAGGRKNLLDNGQFRIWQEGTSFSITGNTVTTSDRFDITSAVGTTLVNRTLNKFPGFTDDVDSSLTIEPQAGASGVSMIQKIEALNSYYLASKSVTFSMLINTNEAITVNLNYKTPSIPDDWSSVISIEDTIPVALSVGDNVVRVTYDNLSSSVFNGVGFEIEPIGFTGGFLELSCALLQSEVGTVATDFEYIPFADDLARCQRYFYSSYPVGVIPGDPAANRSPLFGEQGGFLFGTVTFPVSLRIRPTITIYRPSSGAIGEVEDTSESNPLAVVGAEYSTEGVFEISTNPLASGFQQFHYVADARL